MRLIAIEEHFVSACVEEAQGLGFLPDSVSDGLREIGPVRLAAMDAAGIDMQLLLHTSPGVQNLSPATATDLARESNNELAAICREHPTRFAGLAMVPTPDPEVAADELERGVRTLGLKGGIINGTTSGRFLDDPEFDPILARATELEVPLYIHPSPPPRAVTHSYYKGFSERVDFMFSCPSWGWHIDAGVHLIRMVLGGVFDRHPSLQIVTGHLGQGIPFMLDRMSSLDAVSGLERTMREYFTENFAYGMTGFVASAPVNCALEVFGEDSLMFATDYPYHAPAPIVEDFGALGLAPGTYEKLAYANAERIFDIQPEQVPPATGRDTEVAR